MSQSLDQKRQKELNLIAEVDLLSEEVKSLAVNLAIYLAKAKSSPSAEQLTRMEPEFIRLVNGTVHVVQEMTLILNAARNMERMIYDVPSERAAQTRLETKLRSVLDQCAQILATLGRSKEFRV